MTKQMTKKELQNLQLEERDNLIFDYIQIGQTAIKAFFSAWKEGKVDENQFESFVHKTIEDCGRRIVEDINRPLDEYTKHMDIEIID